MSALGQSVQTLGVPLRRRKRVLPTVRCQASGGQSSTKSVRMELTDPPAHDAPGEHINDEGHVQPTLPGRNIGEVRHPQLIGSISLELPIDPIQWSGSSCIAKSRAYDLAAPHALQAQALHQPLDRAARDGDDLEPRRAHGDTQCFGYSQDA